MCRVDSLHKHADGGSRCRCPHGLAELTIVRYPHHPLADRMWELRHNLTAYDAAFVVLSEALGVPLVTCDARLAAAIEHSAAIELFERG
jgi:predicted nucleic acid-binding protein